MADSSSNGANASGKPCPQSFSAEGPSLIDGFIQHDLVSASTQVRILQIVDQSGGASIGEIVANLPGHPDPVAAILVMVKLKIVVLEVHGVVDANTIVRRADTEPDDRDTNPADPTDPPHEPTSGPIPSTQAENEAKSAMVVRDGLTRLNITPFSPNVVTGHGADRRAFGRIAALNRPGVYALISATKIYIGMGTAVGQRIACGQQPIEDIATVVAITDANGSLSDDDARAAERMLWSRVAAARERTLVNGLPDGASVSAQRYSELDSFLGSACLALRHAQVMFASGSARTVLAGPRQEAGRTAPLRPFADLPRGDILELTFGDGLVALAARQSETHWILLAGSDVRIDTAASANNTTRYLRSAWLHAGLLKIAPDGQSLTATRDLVFASGSAVAQFCTGSKGRLLESWVPIAPDGGFDPDTPALIAA